jgi:hypothetical protein
MVCANSPTDVSFLQQIAVNAAGTVGYAAYQPDQGEASKFIRIDIQGTSCAVTKLDLTGTTLPGAQGYWSQLALALDAGDRMHIADRSADRVAVFDRNGAFVREYKTQKDGTPLAGLIGIAPCTGGMCVLDSDGVSSFDDDGNPRGQRKTEVQRGVADGFLTGSRNGGLFLTGTGLAVDGGAASPVIVVSLAEP